MVFDDLSRGDQFLILLKRDRERLLQELEYDQRSIEHSLRIYVWTPIDEENQKRDLAMIRNDIEELTTLLNSPKELCVIGM